MFVEETVTACSDNRTEAINALVVKNAQLNNFKACGTYRNHCASVSL
jgi:hypothetical protein